MAEEKKATKVKTEAEKAEEFAAELHVLADAATEAGHGSSAARYEQAAKAVEDAHEALVARSAEVAEAKRLAESIAADAEAAAAGLVGEN